MLILGVNAYHGDASACIVQDGKVVVAIEEERIKRVKHWAGLPIESIKCCLQYANVDLADVDVIAVSRDPKAKLLDKLKYVGKNILTLKSLKSRSSNSAKITKIKAEILKAIPSHKKVKAKLVFVEHHRSHLASSFYTSPFEEAILLSVDGFGDFSSTMWGVAKNSKIKVHGSISYPHSLGIFYLTFTQLLGFNTFGDEYKVMGLAAYGRPKYVDRLWKVIQLSQDGTFKLTPKYFKQFKEGLPMSFEKGRPILCEHFTSELKALFDDCNLDANQITQDHKDLACSVQTITEEVLLSLSLNLMKKTGIKNLCLSGGVAQNSVANGKLISKIKIENLFVPPAGGDGGTAIGAALYCYYQLQNNEYTPQKNFSPFLGPDYSDKQILSQAESLSLKTEKLSTEEIIDIAVAALCKGEIIGWFQGRSEFGPRALGNRSFLADPRFHQMREKLNASIKQREPFRPFAASVLEEHQSDYFHNSSPAPFMDKVFEVKEEVRDSIPAIVHANGTCRIQTVSKEYHPIFYKLIDAFYKKTGIPMLLNTSFNIHEPIVNSPDEALNCFLKSKISMLIMNNVMVTKSSESSLNTENQLSENINHYSLPK